MTNREIRTNRLLSDVFAAFEVVEKMDAVMMFSRLPYLSLSPYMVDLMNHDTIYSN